MPDVSRFLKGFSRFKQKYFIDDPDLYNELKKAQRPKTLMLTCVDSRVDPFLLFGAHPGDMMVIRNVAALVPPHNPDAGYHGVSAALEFAVTRLEIETMIVLGHSSCGGINELISLEGRVDESSFLSKWVHLAEEARLEPHGEHDTREEMQCACEKASVILSLKNLMTYPWLRQRAQDKLLKLHGWYFDMNLGQLLEYHPEHNGFDLLKT